MTFRFSGASLFGMKWVLFVVLTQLCTLLSRRHSSFLTSIHHVPVFGPTSSVYKVFFFVASVNMEVPGFLEHVVCYQILCRLGSDICALIVRGGVEALSEKAWKFIWWVCYRCFLVDDTYWYLGGEYSCCFGGLDGVWFPEMRFLLGNPGRWRRRHPCN